jgi:hypothetical protein
MCFCLFVNIGIEYRVNSDPLHFISQIGICGNLTCVHLLIDICIAYHLYGNPGLNHCICVYVSLLVSDLGAGYQG